MSQSVSQNLRQITAMRIAGTTPTKSIVENLDWCNTLIAKHHTKMDNLAREIMILEERKHKLEEAMVHELNQGTNKILREKCTCGKRRYISQSDAIAANRSNDKPIRAYYSDACRCWHTAKRTS